MTMDTADRWNAQRAKDRAQNGGGAYYSREELLEQHLADQRRTQEAEQAQAAEAFNASPAGQLAGLELEMAELAAQMTEAAWSDMWREKGEAAPPKPQTKDLPLESRNRLASERMHQLAADQTWENR
jgi:hypothetical protein